MMPRTILTFFCLCDFLISLTACDSTKEEKPSPPAEEAASVETVEPPGPPEPPLLETFEKDPQLSLFPRAGNARPEDDDKEKLPYWNTFMEHMMRTSGLVRSDGKDGSRGWAIKGIRGIDSIAFFSPIAVRPGTTYRISFSFSGEIPEGGSAGIGILEFDEFLWIGEQYTESLLKEHMTGSHEGVRLTGVQEWKEHSFEFTSGPRTHMIHVILFREGEQDRTPVFFDDIGISATEPPEKVGETTEKKIGESE